ncbi:MAG: LysE family transporter [Methanomassiliicoccus sp.]|nr:LysE family transporter [Methanomassiliicoccus sp.]
MELELIFATAFVLEIIFCAIPGAVTAEALRRGISGGYRPALMVQLGSMIGDLVWAVIALVGLAVLFESVPVRLGLGIIGCVFMLYLAFKAALGARSGDVPENNSEKERGDFLTGVVLSTGNPFQVAFWMGIGATTIAAIAPDPQLEHYAAFMLGFTLAGTLWCFLFAYVVSVGRRFVRPRVFQIIQAVCAVFLAYMGVNMLLSTLRTVGLL